MVEMIGGAIMMIGGASLSASSITLARSTIRRPIEQARQLLGDSAAAVPHAVPPDMAALLDQIP